MSEGKRTMVKVGLTILTMALLFKGLPWVAVIVLVLVMIPDELFWRRS